MQTLKSILSGSIFKMPDLTPEEWAETDARVRAWEQEQEREKAVQRFERAGIPERYKSASITEPAVAEWSADPTIGLLLQGKTGKGKTYQACGALIAALHGGRTARFTTFDDLLRECKATFQNKDTENAVIGRYASTGMLCIDDMGKERLTEWSLPIVFAIVNKRYMAGKPTIITTQYSGKELLRRMTVNGDAETGRAVISRMTEYTRVFMDGKDWRL